MKAAQFVAEIPKLDAEVLAKLQASKSPEEAYGLAKENGLDDTLENFTAEMRALNEKSTALSEDELDSVAGGSALQDVTATVSAATSAASAAASAAAV